MAGDLIETAGPRETGVSSSGGHGLSARRRGLKAVALPAVLLGAIFLGEPPPTPQRTAMASTRTVTDSPTLAIEQRRVREPIADSPAMVWRSPTVIVDPGHGGRHDPGSVGSNGVTEKELTLDIATRLQALLRRAGLRVVLTRTEDREVPLAERVRLANELGGDLFLSIHVNWLEGRTRGIETFHLERGHDTARLEESVRFAAAVHRELRSHVEEVNPSMVDRGVKEAPFRVLAETRMPAILAEVSTLSNDQEADLLELPAYRQYIALALYAGIRSYADGVVVEPSLGS